MDATSPQDSLHGGSVAGVTDGGGHGPEHLFTLRAARGSYVAAGGHHDNDRHEGERIEPKDWSRAERGDEQAARDGTKGAGDIVSDPTERDGR